MIRNVLDMDQFREKSQKLGAKSAMAESVRYYKENSGTKDRFGYISFNSGTDSEKELTMMNRHQEK